MVILQLIVAYPVIVEGLRIGFKSTQSNTGNLIYERKNTQDKMDKSFEPKFWYGDLLQLQATAFCIVVR